MATFLKKDRYGSFVAAREDEAEFVAVPVAEYNGYQNALRILHDRSLQSIDKSQADGAGYTLVRADQRVFAKERSTLMAWYVQKKTPYSLKMPLDAVVNLVNRDLRQYYNLRPLPKAKYKTEYDVIEVACEVEKSGMRPYAFFEKYYKGTLDEKEYEKIFRWLDEVDGKAVLRLDQVKANYGAGVYEIGYWATAII